MVAQAIRELQKLSGENRSGRLETGRLVFKLFFYMNNYKIIEKLSSRSNLTISLYLPLDSNRKSLLSFIHSNLNKLRKSARNLKGREEKYLKATIKKIENYLINFDTRSAKSIALFAGKNFFEVLRIPVLVEPKFHIGRKPELETLSKVLDENPPFIIVLLDRTQAKLLEVNVGEEEAQSRPIKNDVPQKVKSGDDTWDQQNKIFRHIEDHLHRHFIEVIDELKRFEENYPNGLIVIGAQKELVGKFSRELSKEMQAKVIGNFGANADDNETDVIKKAQKIVDSYLKDTIWGLKEIKK